MALPDFSLYDKMKGLVSVCLFSTVYYSVGDDGG